MYFENPMQNRTRTFIVVCNYIKTAENWWIQWLKLLWLFYDGVDFVQYSNWKKNLSRWTLITPRNIDVFDTFRPKKMKIVLVFSEINCFGCRRLKLLNLYSWRHYRNMSFSSCGAQTKIKKNDCRGSPSPAYPLPILTQSCFSRIVPRGRSSGHLRIRCIPCAVVSLQFASSKLFSKFCHESIS